MIYNVDSQLQVFLLQDQLKIPTSVRERIVQFCRFKIHTDFLQQVNAMNKRGLHLLKRRGHSENDCCFFAPQTFAVMMLPNYKHN